MKFDRKTLSTILFIIAGLGGLYATAPAVSTSTQNSAKFKAAVIESLKIDPSVYYPVTAVVDGDTFKVKIEGKEITVRLIGVDTPETVDPRKAVQCFGVEASGVTKSLLEKSTVRLEIDKTQGKTDKYGRLISYVYRGDGIFINKYLIEKGYAHEYTYNTPYKYQAEFKAAEKSAREGKFGLWADGVCN